MSPARCLSPTLKAEVQVNTVIARNADALKPGDVYVLNDPYDGGTHLPDVTVATPVFADLPSPSVNAVADAGAGRRRVRHRNTRRRRVRREDA